MKKSAILLLALIFYRNIHSQVLTVNNPQFNRLSVRNGMPSEIINCVLQDKEGYIWIGAQRGLVRYDGYKTRVYEFGVQELSRLNITNLFEDRFGELWAGTAGNLYEYDRAVDSFIHYEHDPANIHSISPGMICSIRDDREGNLWLLVSDGLDGKATHLNSFNRRNHQFTHYDILEKSGRFSLRVGIAGMLEDSKGHIWFGTNDGAYEFLPSEGKFILHFASTGADAQKTYDWPSEDKTHPGTIWFTVKDTKSEKPEGLVKYEKATDTTTFYRGGRDRGGLETDSVYTINSSSDGRLYFGIQNGLCFFDSVTGRFVSYTINSQKTKTSDSRIRMFAEDSSHNISCGNQTNLFFFNQKDKSFSLYVPNEKDPESPRKGSYNDLLTDRSGTVWLTTFNGIHWLKEKASKFVVYQDEPGQPHYFPGGGGTSFTEGKDGTIWIWCKTGLYHWDSSDSFQRIKSLARKPEGGFIGFSSSSIDRNGRIWLNTFGNGLFSYNPETKETKNYRHNEKDSTSISSDQVSSVFADHSGLIWVGTFGAGLCSLDPQTGHFKRYPFIQNKFQTPNHNALDDANILSLYEDAQNTIWAGTLIGGLNKLDRQSGNFTSFQTLLPGFTTVTSIFEDQQGQLWAATGNGGLFAFDRKNNSAKKFTEQDGLIFSGTLGINEDNQKNLWVSSPRGLSILNQQSKVIIRFGLSNGLPQLPESNLNLFKTKQGELMMPCENGFVVIDPGVLRRDSTEPITHIESVSFRKEDKKEHRETDSVILTYGKKEIDLKYDENRLSFEFVGLSYQNPQLNTYKYYLEGYNDAWTDAGTQRIASFGSLLPGRYIFHLKAANADGVWNSGETRLTVIIRPPWWQSWWAYIIYAVAGLALLRLYILYRSRHLISQNNVLEEKVNTRTIELNQSIVNLKSTQQQLIQSEKMASLGELTAGIAHEIQNPLNFINNFSEINQDMIAEAAEEAGKGNIEEMKSLLDDVKQNSAKIQFHGRRADAIVKGMLQHSRQSKGIKEPTEINALCEEYLKLSYHGLRAKDKNFNSGFSTDLDPSVGKIDIVSQDIARTLLNLFNNAFYAVNEKGQGIPASFRNSYTPMVTVRTKKRGNKVEIRIEDNGNGIPKNIMDKVFQPFFTTKPAGQGTGLGLSLAYEIITKEHNGSIVAKSVAGEGTSFEILLNG